MKWLAKVLTTGFRLIMMQTPQLDRHVGPTKKSAFGKADLPILKSDADEQLLIYIPFKRSVKLHSFSICAPSDGTLQRMDVE